MPSSFRNPVSALPASGEYIMYSSRTPSHLQGHTISPSNTYRNVITESKCSTNSHPYTLKKTQTICLFLMCKTWLPLHDDSWRLGESRFT